MRSVSTLLVVGETALALAVVLALAFFFLILIPGTGAEFRASRNPVHSIATEGRKNRVPTRHNHVFVSEQRLRCRHVNSRCAGIILTLISLAELEEIFRGLYFFSRGGMSPEPELRVER